MKLVATRIVKEMNDGNTEELETQYIVRDGESVEDLAKRVDMVEGITWHYDQMYLVIRLAKE